MINENSLPYDEYSKLIDEATKEEAKLRKKIEFKLRNDRRNISIRKLEKNIEVKMNMKDIIKIFLELDLFGFSITIPHRKKLTLIMKKKPFEKYCLNLLRIIVALKIKKSGDNNVEISRGKFQNYYSEMFLSIQNHRSYYLEILTFYAAYITHFTLFSKFPTEKAKINSRFVFDCYHIAIFETLGMNVSDIFIERNIELYFNESFKKYKTYKSTHDNFNSKIIQDKIISLNSTLVEGLISRNIHSVTMKNKFTKILDLSHIKEKSQTEIQFPKEKPISNKIRQNFNCSQVSAALANTLNSGKEKLGFIKGRIIRKNLKNMIVNTLEKESQKFDKDIDSLIMFQKKDETSILNTHESKIKERKEFKPLERFHQISDKFIQSSKELSNLQQSKLDNCFYQPILENTSKRKIEDLFQKLRSRTEEKPERVSIKNIKFPSIRKEREATLIEPSAHKTITSRVNKAGSYSDIIQKEKEVTDPHFKKFQELDILEKHNTDFSYLSKRNMYMKLRLKMFPNFNTERIQMQIENLDQKKKNIEMIKYLNKKAIKATKVFKDKTRMDIDEK